MGDSTLSASVRLLIVDDHAVVRAGFSSVLRGQVGLDVVGSVQNGEQVLTLLQRSSVDVLLLDLHMPGMSGVEILLALQKFPCPPRAIILSSFDPMKKFVGQSRPEPWGISARTPPAVRSSKPFVPCTREAATSLNGSWIGSPNANLGRVSVRASLKFWKWSQRA